MKTIKVAVGLAVVAGAMDFGTGLGLMAIPAWTLEQMRVPVPGAEALVFVRFVGAFVAAVGASYLWAVRCPRKRIRVMFGLTVWLRGAAGAFTGAAVLGGALAPGWLAVTVTDWTLVGLQAWLLTKGVGCDE